MGNYKFKLSDLIPNAWFYKLNKHISTAGDRRALPSSKNGGIRRQHSPTPHPPLPPNVLNITHPRKSYHFSRQFDTDQPQFPPSLQRKSTNRHRRSSFRKLTARSSPRLVSVSVSAGCSCRTLASFDSALTKPECSVAVSYSDSSSSTGPISPFPQSSLLEHSPGSVPSSEWFDQMLSWTTTSSSCRCRVHLDGSEKLTEGFNHDPLSELELELPPIATKPLEFNGMVRNLGKGGENKRPIATHQSKKSSSSQSSSSLVSVGVVKEEAQTVTVSKEQKKPRPVINSTGLPAGGMRLRVNSPKLASRKLNQPHLHGRKSVSTSASSGLGPNPKRSSGVSDGFAVVKSSADPRKDFRESMVEMIVENNIRASKDLEELLACYLTLNSEEYHDLIITVFKQIWFDFCHARLK